MATKKPGYLLEMCAEKAVRTKQKLSSLEIILATWANVIFKKKVNFYIHKKDRKVT